MGKGFSRTWLTFSKTDILRDMIIVNLQGVLTPQNIEYARHKKAYLTLNERGRNL